MTCKTALEDSEIKTKISFLEINSSENKNKINGTKKVFSEINIFCPPPPPKKNPFFCVPLFVNTNYVNSWSSG